MAYYGIPPTAAKNTLTLQNNIYTILLFLKIYTVMHIRLQRDTKNSCELDILPLKKKLELKAGGK